MKAFCVMDFEANNWIDFVVGGYYDGDHFETFTDLKTFLPFYFNNHDMPDTCYCHFGGIYDFLFIIDYLFSQPKRLFIPQDIILQGKKILKFTVKVNQERKIEFIDSSGLFPFSLKKLTESFKVEHQKLGDIDFNKKLVINKKLLTYLEHDCKGLHECLVKFSNMPYIDGKLSLTRSGQSFQVFKTHFMPDLPFIKSDVLNFVRESYLGGRTEIFKPLFLKQDKLLNVYDINSLYPSVMHDYEYPSTFIGYSNEFDPDTFSIIHCRVKCPININIPVLGIKYNGKYTFPTGIFDGHFTNIELNKALSLGYKIDEIYKIALFDNGGFIFKEFIKHFYDLRKNTDDPVKKILYKDIMNHLYGRLAINDIREQITFKPQANSKIHSRLDYGDYEIRLYSHEKKIFTYTNCVLSSFVTSYARLRLYSYLESNPDDIYYCDTDSIFTTRKIKTGNELGEMKLEYQLDQACFLLPKSYGGFKKDGEFLLKLKGFRNSKNELSNITFSDLTNCLSGETRLPPVKYKGGLAGIKTAFKKGQILSVLPDNQKQLKAAYDKRELVKMDGVYSSKPLNLTYQGKLI